VKASVNSAYVLRAILKRSYILDPKPGELAMGRVKFRESEMEARTGWSCDSFG